MEQTAEREWVSATITRVAGVTYLRFVIKTRWLTADDRLADVLEAAVGDLTCTGDTVVVSEKAAILLSGRAVPISTIRPGRLARTLARLVRPRRGSRGLSVPEKMQYVLDRTGRARILLATAASAVTRPIRIRGMFYRVAGSLARDIDGGRPPFEDILFPPFDAPAARHLCTELESALGVGVAIVDMNDFGGSVRATSPGALGANLLRRVLSDNPLGQRQQRTPIGLVRRLGDAERPLL
jgi:F420-0:gamma-glutamyl ligase